MALFYFFIHFVHDSTEMLNRICFFGLFFFLTITSRRSRNFRTPFKSFNYLCCFFVSIPWSLWIVHLFIFMQLGVLLCKIVYLTVSHQTNFDQSCVQPTQSCEIAALILIDRANDRQMSLLTINFLKIINLESCFRTIVVCYYIKGYWITLYLQRDTL